ncbi:Ig-like domain-containing protein [Nocardioides daphniae]|uniref:Ig-like domain-containing protein n=1 Tax=Nocardioides daphniae TaxID=402297 RepID=UPI0013154780|nr:Ig-like domain-containing protein [Nocardioides daphniae]
MKLRFDLGTDYCGGIHGWAVDDVSVTWCEADVPGAVPSTPVVTPAAGGTPLELLDEVEPTADPADETSDETADDTSGARAATRTRVQAPARGVRPGRAFTLTARVSGTDGGRVRFTVGGRVVGTAKVVDGVARLKVRPRTARLVRVGQRRAVAAYLGTAKAAPSKGRATLRVRR